jgi:acetolactate synthase-1/2/3 large subunit
MSAQHNSTKVVHTGAHQIWEVLGQAGVDTVFGYPGGAIMPAYDALSEYPIRHVLARHEQGATHMADGYARATGRLGVAIATSGPGATNLVTGLATAKLDSVPMLCITGQVPSPLLGTDAFQEVDITRITKAVTKYNALVTRAEDIAPTLAKAIQVATSGRPGPVLVDITKDAQQNTSIFHSPMPHCLRAAEVPSWSGDLPSALGLLRSAKRPLVMGGHGVIMSGASEELTRLAEVLGAPVAHTLLGLGGVSADHPLHLGMAGMHGHGWVNHAIQKADVLLAVGMRFDDRVTGCVNEFARNAKIIHVELDRREVGKIITPEVALLGDAKAVLSSILNALGEHTPSLWSEEILQMKSEGERSDQLLSCSTDELNAARILRAISARSKEDTIVVTDVGQHQMWEAQYFPHVNPRSLLTSGGLGTMGFALPAAIGAKVARPEAEVWVVAGDGGFQMTACELATCRQDGVNVNIAILNNGYLGMVRQWQEFFYEERYVSTPILSPDFSAMARAHGLHGLTVERWSEVDAAISFARASRETCVLDFRIPQKDSVYPMVAPGKGLGQMIHRPQ